MQDGLQELATKEQCKAHREVYIKLLCSLLKGLLRHAVYSTGLGFPRLHLQRLMKTHAPKTHFDVHGTFRDLPWPGLVLRRNSMVVDLCMSWLASY